MKNPFEDDWQEGLDRLHAYVEEHGNARVPRGYITDEGYRLGGWVSNQRTVFNQGILSEPRVAALEVVPGWTWEPFEDDWQEGLDHLRAYAEEHGHARMPALYVTDEGFRLGSWVSKQRAVFSEGSLSESRIAALKAVPGWTWDPRADHWQEGLDHLRVYAEEHGHALVPQKYVTDDGYRLGVWVSIQRRNFSEGSLSESRIAALKAVPGWTWRAN